MRLLYNPQYNGTLTVQWRTDNDDWKTRTVVTGPNGYPAVGSTFKVAVSALPSRNTAVALEFPLDCRGRDIKWKITTTDPRFALLGWEIDMVVAGNEVE